MVVVLKFSLFIYILGSLRNDDGDGNDNATNQSFDWSNGEK